MKIGLFIPCYINAIYPGVGVASYKLLTSLGLDVDYPLDQTCCGSQWRMPDSRRIRQASQADGGIVREYDYVVGPSAGAWFS